MAEVKAVHDQVNKLYTCYRVDNEALTVLVTEGDIDARHEGQVREAWAAQEKKRLDNDEARGVSASPSEVRDPGPINRIDSEQVRHRLAVEIASERLNELGKKKAKEPAN